MERQNFDYLWNNIIMKAVNNFINSLPQDLITKYDIYVRNEHTLKKKIYKDYESQKNTLKKRYYEGINASGKIDQHKISSCICISIINNKIVSYNLSEDMPPDLLFANYKIAFDASIGIIFMYLLDYYSTMNDNLAIETLKQHGTLFLPVTSNGNDSYDTCIIKMLTLNDIYGDAFNVLAYSNIMFCLEEYNKTYIKNS